MSYRAHLDRPQRFLYSVHADLEEVSAYAIDKQNGRITALNRQSCGGKNPVHLSIDPTGRWIVTANYSAGTVGVVPIEKDGTLGPRSDLVNLPGEPAPDRKQQASSHPHNAVFDPSGQFIAVPDKGLDRVFVFRLDAAGGKLMPNDPPFVATRAGAALLPMGLLAPLPYRMMLVVTSFDCEFDCCLSFVAVGTDNTQCTRSGYRWVKTRTLGWIEMVFANFL